MRSTIIPAAVAAVVLTSPTQSASSHKRHYQSVRAASHYGALYTRPSYSPYYGSETGGTPAIYRFNHYQGTDPDPQVRLDLMRDGRNYGH